MTEGLQAGLDDENVQDGFNVTYDKFLVVLGGFEAESSADAAAHLHSDETTIVDMRNLPTGGLPIASFKDAPAIRFDRFSYAMVPATADAKAQLLSATDEALMRDNGYSLYVAGTLSKVGSNDVNFAFGFKGGTRFGACGVEGGQAGFAVTAGGTTAIKPTLHGDHWFFTSNPHATTPKRLATWITLCDDNADGTVTDTELTTHGELGTLFPTSDGYNLAGLPVQPILTAFQYFSAQARTLGHYNGDGDCEEIEILNVDPREPANLMSEEGHDH